MISAIALLCLPIRQMKLKNDILGLFNNISLIIVRHSSRGGKPE